MTISRIARRLIAGALVTTAAAAAAPTGASAATEAPELTTQIKTLVSERLNVLEQEKQFVPVNPNPRDVEPGQMVEARIRDRVDPSGFLTQKNRRKINLATAGFASLVGLDISIKWTAHDDKGNPLSADQANSSGPTFLPFAGFMFAPEVIQKGLPPAEHIQTRFLRATLTVSADPPPVSTLVEPLEGQLDRLAVPIDLQGATQADIEELKRVDVDPVERDIVVDIPIPVLPLPVPNILMSFRHDNYKLSDDIRFQTDAGFLLVTVPSETGFGKDIVKVQNTVNKLRDQVDRLKGLPGLLFDDLFGALGIVKTQLDTWQSKAANRIQVREGSEFRNLNNESGFTMIQRCRCFNDIEAEDEISSMISLGIPGSGWKAFANRRLGGSALEIRAGGKFITEVRNLHQKRPAGTLSPNNPNRKSWGDSFSSLQVLASKQTLLP